MTLEDAIIADRKGELQLAATAYEHVLTSGEVSLEALLNLAVLYWQATDPGMAAAKKLSHNFFTTAGRRTPELLADAQRLFPKNAAPRFWSRYIAWADLNEPFDSEECREFMREDPATLVPAMRLFAASDGREAEAAALELYRQCQDDGTTRARYVASVIQAVLKRTGAPETIG